MYKRQVIDGANIVSVRNNGVNFSLSATEILELFYTPASKRNVPAPRTRSREDLGTVSLENDENESEIIEDSTNNKKPKNKKERKINNSFAMERIYGWSKKIEPLSISINNTTNLTSNAIQGKVPLKYRFGLSDTHGLDHASEVGLNTGVDDIKKSLSIRSGIKFDSNTSMNISFSESISSNLNGYGIDIRSINRDYFAYGEHLSDGLPFSNWAFRIGGLEKIKFISPYVNSLSIEHAFNGKQTVSWKFNDPGIGAIDLLKISSFVSDNDDYIQFARVSRNFTPLIGITTSFKNGISTNIRTNVVHTLDEVPNGLTYISENSILASLTYNFTKGIRVPLPFTERDIYLKNNINLTLNIDVSEKKEEGSKDKINFAEQNFVDSWKTILRVTYTLTDNVSGSLFYEYRVNDTRLTGRRTDRDFGININVAIRG